jgi:hypothetical protein
VAIGEGWVYSPSTATSATIETTPIGAETETAPAPSWCKVNQANRPHRRFVVAEKDPVFSFDVVNKRLYVRHVGSREI